MAALLGRPCAIQLDEVDIPTFTLDVPAVEFRYVERMRQFSRLTWEWYYETYSLVYKGSSAIEREKVSVASDSALSNWKIAWNHSRSDNSHELIVKMRELINLLNPRAKLITLTCHRYVFHSCSLVKTISIFNLAGP
jgi:hypothetical protein